MDKTVKTEDIDIILKEASKEHSLSCGLLSESDKHFTTLLTVVSIIPLLVGFLFYILT